MSESKVPSRNEDFVYVKRTSLAALEAGGKVTSVTGLTLVKESSLGAGTEGLKDLSGSGGTGVCVTTDEKKEGTQKLLFRGLGMGASGFGQVKVRLPVGAALMTMSAGAATAKIPWSPLSLGEFASFAALFTEYHVEAIRHHFWFERADAATSASVFLIASDPVAALSGTPTSLTVSQLSKCQRWLPAMTSKMAPCYTTVPPQTAAGAYALNGSAKGKGSVQRGFLPVTTAWNGQTCVFVQSISTSTDIACLYQTEFDLVFRFRQ